jgi:hypothetical protein
MPAAHPASRGTAADEWPTSGDVAYYERLHEEGVLPVLAARRPEGPTPPVRADQLCTVSVSTGLVPLLWTVSVLTVVS